MLDLMLLKCDVYKNGKKAAEIDPLQIRDYLTQADCFVWVALHDPDDATLAEMQQQLDLHPLAVEDTRHGHQRPKIEQYGDSLFVVIHMIEETDAEYCVGQLTVFAGRNYVLSVRSRAKRGFQEVRARAEHEPELLRRGSGYVLYALMDAVVDRYFPELEKLESELERIEEQIFSSNTPRANIEALYALKQKLLTIKHAVGPLLEGVSNLSGGHVPMICQGLQEYFRDIYDHLLRLNQTIDSVRDTVATAISVNLSMITLQEGETTKRLAAYAALIAVPTLIVGIYGMNFLNMPELHWRFGYPAVMLFMAALDGYLYWRFRRAQWL
jgi:magnesium transporter